MRCNGHCPKGVDEVKHAKIVLRYQDGMRITHIQRELRVNVTTIYKVLKAHNVPLRPRKCDE